MKKHFPVFLSFNIVITGVLLSLVLVLLFDISSTLFSQTFAVSPTFDESLIFDKIISNQKSDLVQTYGNACTSFLGINYANILAVDSVSDGITFNTTFWLASNSQNASISNSPPCLMEAKIWYAYCYCNIADFRKNIQKEWFQNFL